AGLSRPVAVAGGGASPGAVPARGSTAAPPNIAAATAITTFSTAMSSILRAPVPATRACPCPEERATAGVVARWCGRGGAAVVVRPEAEGHGRTVVVRT